MKLKLFLFIYKYFPSWLSSKMLGSKYFIREFRKVFYD